MSLYRELKRRNVFRVGAAYVVVAWLVIQVVETIFPAFGFGDAAIRIATIVFIIGLIPTLIFAWAFELTPEGLKKESEVDRSQSITQHTGKKLDRMIMLVLALALGYFAFDKFVLTPQREAAAQEQVVAQVEQARQEGRTEALVESYGDHSIAVLAFDDMSPDGDQEYLSDGIAEELLNLLAKIPELRVISRSSAFSYKGKDIKLNEIAEELNVAHILEGSVRKAGNRVRITTQLIEARSDTHLWSETYDRKLDDIFAIQDDIAATVVDELKITLLGATPQVEETDPEAYALLLQARHFGRLGSEEGWAQSNTLYEQALTIDPDYAAAWDGLATNYINMVGRGVLPADEGVAKARAAAQKALAIDPDFAPAHGRLGWIEMYYGSDLAQAARHFERALRLDPTDPKIKANASGLLSALGRVDDDIAIREYVAARDPVNPTSHYNLGVSYLSADRWEAAIAALETCLRLSPDQFFAETLIADALLFKGEPRAAVEKLQSDSPGEYELMVLAMAYHALGERERSDQALAELIEEHGQQAPSLIGAALAYREEYDRAFEWLDKAVGGNDPYVSFMSDYPTLRKLHDDPRWEAFLEAMGRSPERLSQIEFEVELPD